MVEFKKTNHTLNLIKLIASYMVVFIHVPFYGKLGSIVISLARFAVPLFFFSSGFMSYNISCEKILNRTKKLLKLFISSSVIFVSWSITSLLILGNKYALADYFKIFSLTHLKNLLLFNETSYAGHFWYLVAIIYVYIIYYVLIKIRVNEKLLLFVACGLLSFTLITYDFLFFPSFTICHSLHMRNFIFFGFPFFYLGVFLKKHEAFVKKAPFCLAVCLLILGICETLLSLYLFGSRELYIGSVLILFANIIFFIKLSDKTYCPTILKLSACSKYIYIYHVLIFYILLFILGYSNIDTSSVTFNMIHPLIICVLSTVLAHIINEIQRKKAH